jgi:NADPH2:quinone reductase
LAKAHGLRVFGTASTPEGEALAKESGCEEVFNHREPDYIEKIKQQHPNGFDIIVEMLANVNLCNDLQLIATQGRIIVIGSRGKVEIDPRSCMQKEASIIGVMASLTTADVCFEDSIYSLFPGVSTHGRKSRRAARRWAHHPTC